MISDAICSFKKLEVLFMLSGDYDARDPTIRPLTHSVCVSASTIHQGLAMDIHLKQVPGFG